MTRLELMELAEECSDVLIAMEDDLLQNIAEYLSGGRTDIPAAQWKIQQLASLGKLDKANIRTIAEYSGIAADMEEIAMTRSALKAVSEMDDGFGKLAADGIISGTEVPMEETALQTAAMYSKQAKDRLNKVNTVMRYFAKNTAAAAVYKAEELINKQQHLDTLNKAAGKVIMGAESRQTAVRQCIKEMSEKGIPAFVDAAGRQWSPEAYINMDVRTTCSNVAHEAQFARMNDYGIDLLEVDSHAGARPKCALDQGKIFSKSGKHKKYPAWSTSSYGEPDGILGINCGHHIYPYIEGVSTQTYFPYDKEENDKLYKQKQEQRKLEREVRSAKREVSMLNAAGDQEGAKLAKERVKSRTAAYNAYCEKAGLPRKADRLTAQGYKTKAENEKKALLTLDKIGGSGIIKDTQQSELGRFKERLKFDKRVDEKYYEMISSKFSHGTDVAKKAFNKFVPVDSVADSVYLDTPCYGAKKIFMNFKADLNNPRGNGATWFHEHGHMIDDLTGNISNDKKFKELIDADIMAYRKEVGRKNNLKTFDKVDTFISKELQDFRKHSGVSDIFDGATKGNISGCAYHKSGYWNTPNTVTSEAFAHMYEAQFDQIRYKEMKKYFPNSLKYMEEKLKEVTNR